MISGAYVMIFTRDEAADRAFQLFQQQGFDGVVLMGTDDRSELRSRGRRGYRDGDDGPGQRVEQRHCC